MLENRYYQATPRLDSVRLYVCGYMYAAYVYTIMSMA